MRNFKYQAVLEYGVVNDSNEQKNFKALGVGWCAGEILDL